MVLLRNMGWLFVYVVLNHAPFTVILVLIASRRFVDSCHSIPSFIIRLPLVVVEYVPRIFLSVYGRLSSEGLPVSVLALMAPSS